MRQRTRAQVALLLGINDYTLVSYEKAGIIAPGRSLGGYYLYSDADVERVREHALKSHRIRPHLLVRRTAPV